MKHSAAGALAAVAAFAMSGLGGAQMSAGAPAPKPQPVDFDPRAKGRPYRIGGGKRWHGECFKKRAQRLARRAERRGRK